MPRSAKATCESNSTLSWIPYFLQQMLGVAPAAPLSLIAKLCEAVYDHA
jgi:hypothetical protein